MKILVLNGSPRPQGNTAAMVEAFARGAREGGHRVDVVDVCRKKIAGCLACEYCHQKGSGHERQCAQRDDMQMLYPLLDEAEMIVLASPVYYHGFSGQLQCAVNRIYALDKPKRLKRAALILSSGSDHVYSGAIFEYQNSFLLYLGLQDMGMFTAHGRENASPEKLEELYNFGRGLRDGALHPDARRSVLNHIKFSSRKKHLMKRALVFLLAIMLCAAGGGFAQAEGASSAPQSTVQEGESQVQQATENPNLAIRVPEGEDHYIFELNENVQRTQVYFTNRYGIELAGDLYVAKDADLSQSHPGLVVGPPFGGVKEQGPGVYANELAQRGFVVLAFDPSYHGYSGGQPRYTGSTDIYAEDFSAGVDYLGSLGYVNREQIGAIGICGSGGFALSAAAADARIQAVAAVVMYDIPGLGNSSTGEARQQMLEQLAQARWDEVDNGPAVSFSYPDQPTEEVPAELSGPLAEFYSFYGTSRGWHPNARGNVTATSNMSLANFPALTHIGEISPRPILFVAGENAHSLGFSQSAYEQASEPKELYLVPEANHVDLYDDVTKIPFDKLESFFSEAFGM